ncbi:hypothetical protein OGV37_15220 [Citrobacter sp. Cb010]|uniref:hypothetical protein n=1 Tax=unclassified Citrobacter TaxID=2644389 RepID=UPI0015E55EE7|nr:MULTISPECIES: hypothetical protein [unclassified Citrobacter]MBA8328698.1 hypothetical protein [Citrobacter freundii]HBC8789000.1 hypothetical protein [Citrobacter braakii]MBA8332804.1 hypothetical protein [Citrobacter freundii]MDM3376214.1 hypothetical protein [Citrobacter sp. Cb010]MDM3459427.1 hypothetical protein [Citrobacter sp. Cb036]
MKIEITDSLGKVVCRASSADMINRKQMCSLLGINNVEFCRVEKLVGFERALKRMLDKYPKV